jgi:hypothetical protein
VNRTGLKEEILQAAEGYLQTGEIPFLPYQGYEEYLESGNRVAFEKHYFARRRMLVVLGLTYEMERKADVKALLEQLLWEICNEYTWCLPAHLPIVNGRFYSQERHTLDLFAAETGQALAELLMLIGEELSAVVKERVRYEIDQRLFLPFEQQTWSWETKENNWSAVVGGCLGMAALYLLPKKSERQLGMIKRLDTAMQSYLNSFGEDGACIEGVGYWAYGFGYYLYYAQLLAAVLQDDTYLKLPKARKIAAFPYYMMISPGHYLPFSDYSAIELPSGLVSYCYEHFGVKIPQLTGISQLDFDPCYRFAHIYRNLQWHTEAITQEKKASFHHDFEQAQWFITKGTRSDFFFAAKGGSNHESHNHLDVGHFVLGTTEELFLTDLGAGEYTKDYFDDKKRYNYFPPAAASHSLPIINQQMQVATAEKATVLQVNEKRFDLELSAFYPPESVSSFKRHFILSPQEVIIEDDFDFGDRKQKNLVVENFITKIPPVIQGRSVKLSTGKGHCFLHFTSDRIQIKTVTYQDHQGRQAQAYLIQAEYQLDLTGKIKTAIQIKKG